jgi:hypothetical protein
MHGSSEGRAGPTDEVDLSDAVQRAVEAGSVFLAFSEREPSSESVRSAGHLVKLLHEEEAFPDGWQEQLASLADYVVEYQHKIERHGEAALAFSCHWHAELSCDAARALATVGERLGLPSDYSLLLGLHIAHLRPAATESHPMTRAACATLSRLIRRGFECALKCQETLPTSIIRSAGFAFRQPSPRRLSELLQLVLAWETAPVAEEDVDDGGRWDRWVLHGMFSGFSPFCRGDWPADIGESQFGAPRVGREGARALFAVVAGAAFVGDKCAIAGAVRLLGCSTLVTVACGAAVLGGQAGLIQWLKTTYGLAFDSIAPAGWTADLIKDVAALKRLAPLHPPDRHMMIEAIAAGALPAIQYLHDCLEGGPLLSDAALCKHAVTAAQLPALRWLRAHGYAWDKDDCLRTAIHKNYAAIAVWIATDGAVSDAVLAA